MRNSQHYSLLSLTINVHFLLQIIWIVSFIEYLGIHVGKCTRETWIILKMYKVLHQKQNHHSWLYLTLSAYIYKKKKLHFIIYFAPMSHLVTFLRNLKQRAFIYCVLKNMYSFQCPMLFINILLIWYFNLTKIFDISL